MRVRPGKETEKVDFGKLWEMLRSEDQSLEWEIKDS